MNKFSKVFLIALFAAIACPMYAMQTSPSGVRRVINELFGTTQTNARLRNICCTIAIPGFVSFAYNENPYLLTLSLMSYVYGRGNER